MLVGVVFRKFQFLMKARCRGKMSEGKTVTGSVKRGRKEEVDGGSSTGGHVGSKKEINR
jgi:hypothetical protein